MVYADWKSLIDLSFDQGVAAIAVDGLQGSIAHDNDGSLRQAQEPAHQPTKTGAEAGSGGRLTESQRLMLEDILAPKVVRHYESRFLAHLNILRMLWANRWKFRLYSDTTLIATVWRYVYGHWFDRDNVEVIL